VDPLIMYEPGHPVRISNDLGDNGHFTAIVAAKSTKMGCGMVRDDVIVPSKVVYVCDYSPQGNIIQRLRAGGPFRPQPAYDASHQT
jgi:hypothetical protein